MSRLLVTGGCEQPNFHEQIFLVFVSNVMTSDGMR